MLCLSTTGRELFLEVFCLANIFQHPCSNKRQLYSQASAVQGSSQTLAECIWQFKARNPSQIATIAAQLSLSATEGALCWIQITWSWTLSSSWWRCWRRTWPRKSGPGPFPSRRETHTEKGVCPAGRRGAGLFFPTEGWTLSRRAPPSLSGLAGDTHTHAAGSPMRQSCDVEKRQDAPRREGRAATEQLSGGLLWQATRLRVVLIFFFL